MRRRSILAATVVAVALIAEPALAMPRSSDVLVSPSAERRGPSGGGSVAPDVAGPGWAAADVTGPRPVIRTRRITELTYAESDGYLAWGTVDRRERFRVWARKKGERRHRVHRASFDAAMGGVDGHRLVYQEVRPRGRSNIRLYDMEERRRTNPGRKVNSGHWEYWPSLSGDWILFFRTNLRETRNWAFLYNMKTKERRRLDLVRGGRGILLGGQVAQSAEGSFAAWTKCTRRTCQVFRYNVADRTKTRVPNPGGRPQYAAGVDPEGTVYYARSGFRCGRNVGIWKHRLAGSPERLVTLPRGIDLSSGFVYFNAAEPRNQYSFSRLNCRTFRADIYEIWDDDVTR